MNLVFLQFIVCSFLILFAGKKIARYGDIIAEKTGLGGVWVGLILLALATSLPEIFTGIGSILFVKDPNLTVGNLLGANSYNLLNIALLDFLNKGGPLLSVVSSGQLITAWFSLVPIVLVSLGIVLVGVVSLPEIGHISILSFLILFSYFFATRKIYVFEKAQQKTTSKKSLPKYEGIQLKTVGVLYGINALVIVLAGIWLAHIGDALVGVLSLNSSFVGTLFLGFATTLPEVVVSIAALRIGARDMAVANMLGSNLFNMVVIFIIDLLYRKGSIFSDVSPLHLFTCAIVFVMTAVIIVALTAGRNKVSILKGRWYALLLIIIFIIGAFINFRFQ